MKNTVPITTVFTSPLPTFCVVLDHIGDPGSSKVLPCHARVQATEGGWQVCNPEGLPDTFVATDLGPKGILLHSSLTGGGAVANLNPAASLLRSTGLVGGAALWFPTLTPGTEEAEEEEATNLLDALVTESVKFAVQIMLKLMMEERHT